VHISFESRITKKAFFEVFRKTCHKMFMDLWRWIFIMCLLEKILMKLFSRLKNKFLFSNESIKELLRYFKKKVFFDKNFKINLLTVLKTENFLESKAYLFCFVFVKKVFRKKFFNKLLFFLFFCFFRLYHNFLFF